MTDREKVDLVRGLLLSACETGMVGCEEESAVGYVNGIVDACIDILGAEEDADEQKNV